MPPATKNHALCCVELMRKAKTTNRQQQQQTKAGRTFKSLLRPSANASKPSRPSPSLSRTSKRRDPNAPTTTDSRKVSSESQSARNCALSIILAAGDELPLLTWGDDIGAHSEDLLVAWPGPPPPPPRGVEDVGGNLPSCVNSDEVASWKTLRTVRSSLKVKRVCPLSHDQRTSGETAAHLPSSSGLFSPQQPRLLPPHPIPSFLLLLPPCVNSRLNFQLLDAVVVVVCKRA